jgi:hypothetical protein
MEQEMTQQGWQPLPQGPMMPAPGFYTPPPPSKPSTFYKVIGMLWIFLGVGGVLYALFSIASTLFMGSYTARFYDSATLTLVMALTSGNILTGSMLGITGFGLFRGRRWSRPLGVTYATLSMLSTLASTVLQITVIQPRVLATSAGVGRTFAHEIGAIFGALIMLVVPTITLIAVLRGQAKLELDQ